MNTKVYKKIFIDHLFNIHHNMMHLLCPICFEPFKISKDGSGLVCNRPEGHQDGEYIEIFQPMNFESPILELRKEGIKDLISIDFIEKKVVAVVFINTKPNFLPLLVEKDFFNYEIKNLDLKDIDRARNLLNFM